MHYNTQRCKTISLVAVNDKPLVSSTHRKLISINVFSSPKLIMQAPLLSLSPRPPRFRPLALYFALLSRRAWNRLAARALEIAFDSGKQKFYHLN